MYICIHGKFTLFVPEDQSDSVCACMYVCTCVVKQVMVSFITPKAFHSELAPCFTELCCDGDFRVRKTIASIFHEVWFSHYLLVVYVCCQINEAVLTKCTCHEYCVSRRSYRYSLWVTTLPKFRHRFLKKMEVSPLVIYRVHQ